jgi:hypothetical protein
MPLCLSLPARERGLKLIDHQNPSCPPFVKGRDSPLYGRFVFSIL